jgi:hypothetical protein
MSTEHKVNSVKRIVIHNHLPVRDVTLKVTATIYKDSDDKWHWKPKGRWSPSPPFNSKEEAKTAARAAGYTAFFIDEF